MLELHYSGDSSCMFVNGKEVFKFKANSKSVNFLTQFCLGSISNRFGATESRQVSWRGNVRNFSVDYSVIDKSDILNIDKNLTVKKNIK